MSHALENNLGKEFGEEGCIKTSWWALPSAKYLPRLGKHRGQTPTTWQEGWNPHSVCADRHFCHCSSIPAEPNPWAFCSGLLLAACKTAFVSSASSVLLFTIINTIIKCIGAFGFFYFTVLLWFCSSFVPVFMTLAGFRACQCCAVELSAQALTFQGQSELQKRRRHSCVSTKLSLS